MYTIHFSTQARKQFKLLKKRYQLALVEALQDLQSNPLIGKPLLRELTGKLTYRVGIYRIIYSIRKKDHSITIYTIGHRSNVY